jgi:hypothetical protein
VEVRVPLVTVVVVGEFEESTAALDAFPPPGGGTKASETTVEVVEGFIEWAVGGPEREGDEAVAPFADVPVDVGSDATSTLGRTGAT